MTDTPKTSWTVRRLFLFITSAFAMGCITIVLYKAMDTAAAETAVAMSFALLMSNVGAYVFGATWDNKGK